jgi:hypothetical protein
MSGAEAGEGETGVEDLGGECCEGGGEGVCETVFCVVR